MKHFVASLSPAQKTRLAIEIGKSYIASVEQDTPDFLLAGIENFVIHEFKDRGSKKCIAYFAQ